MRHARVVAPLALAALALAGCRGAADHGPSAAPDDSVRVVSRTPPPDSPRAFRFELVETAVLSTGTDPNREVEISLPIASSDPGVQTVESMLVTITPDRPYDVVQDLSGNRFVRVRTKGPDSISCEIAYRVSRTPFRVDLAKEEDRPLSEDERRLLAPELGPDPPVCRHRFSTVVANAVLFARVGKDPVAWLRSEGVPARPLHCVALRGEHQGDASVQWFEAFLPGAGWAAFEPNAAPFGGLPETLLVVSRRSRTPAPVPVATQAGAPVALAVGYRWSPLADR